MLLALTFLADDNISDCSSVCSDCSYQSELDQEHKSINFNLSNGAPIDTTNFNIVHYNINSILAHDKLEQLTAYSKLLNIDILIITESKLDKNIPNNLITIPGYHEPIRHDRATNGRNGGGVLMYIADHLIFQHKVEFQSKFYEHIWVDIKLKDTCFAINALYRPPNESQEAHQHFLETAENILNQLNSYDKAEYKIISSDLNFGNCFCKNPSLGPKPLDFSASELFESYGFHQLIDIPTRVTLGTISLIDLVFTNKLDNITCHGTLPKVADHDGTIVCFSTKSKKVKQKTKIVYDYNDADEAGLLKFFKDYDFESTVFNQPINKQAEIFTNVLQDAFSKFIPCKTVLVRPSDQSWCNNFTRLLIRKKNRNYQFYKKCELEYQNSIKSNQNPELITRLLNKRNKAHNKARDAANESSKANRRAKMNFYDTVNNTMKNSALSPKKKYSILFKLMKNSKFSNISPLIENNKTILDPLEKSNVLNEFFASKSSVQNPNDPVPFLQRMDIISSLDIVNTSPIEVAKIIRNTKRSYSSYCGVPGKFLHIISTPISFSMSRLLNNLFSNGHFPDIWKIAHITAIYKRSGPKTDKSNFRPISLLPTLSKVAESVMHDRLFKHCVENDIISHKQAAYLKGDSTISQLLYIVHNIRNNWAHNKITHGLFLDVSSAFDKVWHKGLLAKLSQVGVHDMFYEIISSYLNNRKQIVVVDGQKSDVLDIRAGVPQGSRLGPLLFLIYMNDITDDIESDILIFADDTSLFVSGTDPAETAEILNRDLQKISSWATRWKVKFNASKTKNIIFSNKVLNNSPPLLFNENFNELVNSHKHLGLYFSSTLNWSKQIFEVCLKANRKLLRSVKMLSRQTLDMLYKQTVRSVIDYGLPVYCNTLKQTELSRLENLQYRAAKIVTGTYQFTSRDKLNSELGWETIKKRCEILSLNIFHKIHRYETRPLIRNCMPKPDIEQRCLTRSKGGYIPFKKYDLKFNNSFFPHTTLLWNNLPKDVKCKDLTDFKLYIKTELKPPRYKHFSRGKKHSNTLLTKIRVGRSDLNQHKFTIGLVDSPICDCHYKEESTSHYFLDCFLYTPERQILFGLFEHYIPKFANFTKAKKLEIILRGFNIENNDFIPLNITLTLAVQNFILNTKRFC